ncbi:hypothetical protein K458DRAFT_388302 [Lentithecium fluviatile CBS 122367]|uniref:Uncharacterized protein n=1 Tax=Lentithecium fluviatile CBS 122367 TaxID=1168545 RepID=A0A6G1J5B2_9PLEO|nr:hypothetical protein K458DRAFT_388302 [Lentithecium fluviatile CBS 122367]
MDTICTYCGLSLPKDMFCKGCVDWVVNEELVQGNTYLLPSDLYFSPPLSDAVLPLYIGDNYFGEGPMGMGLPQGEQLQEWTRQPAAAHQAPLEGESLLAPNVNGYPVGDSAAKEVPKPAAQLAAVAGPKRKGRPPGVKNSGPRKKPGQKAEERRLAEARGALPRPGRPKGKADAHERAKAGQGRNYDYGKRYREKMKAEKGNQNEDQ